MPWKFAVVVFGCVGYFQLVSEVVALGTVCKSRSKAAWKTEVAFFLAFAIAQARTRETVMRREDQIGMRYIMYATKRQNKIK